MIIGLSEGYPAYVHNENDAPVITDELNTLHRQLIEARAEVERLKNDRATLAEALDLLGSFTLDNYTCSLTGSIGAWSLLGKNQFLRHDDVQENDETPAASLIRVLRQGNYRTPQASKTEEGL
jgi:hypothetical protein